jgi:hypothetical protein
MTSLQQCFFVYIKWSISEHSGSIGICIKNGEKSLLFCFLNAKGAEGESIADMSAKKSIFFIDALANYLY